MEKEKSLLSEIQNSILKGGFIQAANYHNTHGIHRNKIEKELQYFKQHFSPVSLEDLDKFYETGIWHKKKPGLIISIFEGYRNNYDIMFPLLEKYGFIGWFHIPTKFLDIPISEQKQFADDHVIEIFKDEEYKDDKRYAMTWDELREIDKNHVIGSHTQTHFRVKLDTPENQIKDEIIGSKHKLEEKLQHEIEIFCWLGGEDFRCNTVASKYIGEAGYKYLFSNLKIQKLL